MRDSFRQILHQKLVKTVFEIRLRDGTSREDAIALFQRLPPETKIKEFWEDEDKKDLVLVFEVLVADLPSAPPEEVKGRAG